MEGKPKYTYKDIDGALHYTRGKFIGWQRGGLLNVWHAGFERRRSAIFVPEYLLTPETMQALPPRPAQGEA